MDFDTFTNYDGFDTDDGPEDRDRNPGRSANERWELTDEIEGKTRVSIMELRTYAGKACSIAPLGDVTRPFIKDVCGTIRAVDDADKPSKASPNCAWTVQIMPATDWRRAFLSRSAA